MKHLYLLLIHLVLFMGACAGNKSANETATNKQEKVIVAYVTSWSDGIPETKHITHINYAFGHVNETFDGVRIDKEDRLRQIVGLKSNHPELKIMLSIGGWGSGRFSEMAADENLRKSFAADCQRVVQAFKLDGIDIDWEYPTSPLAGISYSPDDRDNYTLLMRDIRAAIGKDKLLTHATAANAEHIDYRATDQYLDFTNVMAYDMGNPPLLHSALYRSENAGGHTSDEAIKKHLAAGVPKHKLVMGMPFYGRAVQGFSRPKDLTKAHEMEGYTYHWDDIAKVPYLTDSTGVLVFGYENIESLTIKCQYILDNELLGAMYWDYSGDNEAGDLQRTVYETLYSPNN
ncbi:glycoside hydrolase family 18 protein [Parabacteroides sp. PF5-9]|uniref:glycoside hydrolase family 18 protein n=1 Tax=Parabacteroides sp. PF5-9 TaxID=1742404 RepID=UPI002474316E|nr:glycoside hydrolase family 18 protein [Parabacteroides sp. PF5-9]MDH6358887.1 GH18 family chitinase [Parabacteroides sp. PF5-9]